MTAGVRDPSVEGPCPGCATVAQALGPGHPALVAALPHSVLLLGDHQAFPGYCVLWSRTHAKELHHLPPAEYLGLMGDLRRASAAVERATGCRKLNVVSLGNVVPHAHLHLFPRSAADPQRLAHPWVHEARFHDPGEASERRRWIQAIQESLA